MTAERLQKLFRRKSAATSAMAPLDEEVVRISVALAHLKQRGNLDGFTATRNEKVVLMEAASRQGLVTWVRKRGTYELTSLGERVAAYSKPGRVFRAEAGPLRPGRFLRLYAWLRRAPSRSAMAAAAGMALFAGLGIAAWLPAGISIVSKPDNSTQTIATRPVPASPAGIEAPKSPAEQPLPTIAAAPAKDVIKPAASGADQKGVTGTAPPEHGADRKLQAPARDEHLQGQARTSTPAAATQAPPPTEPSAQITENAGKGQLQPAPPPKAKVADQKRKSRAKSRDGAGDEDSSVAGLRTHRLPDGRRVAVSRKDRRDDLDAMQAYSEEERPSHRRLLFPFSFFGSRSGF